MAHPAACGHYETQTAHVDGELIAGLGPSLTGAVLCGLHPCGDLSPVLLRAFVDSRAAAVAFVGCCYHALTDSRLSPVVSDADGSQVGFPLSAAARAMEVVLTPAQRELACHAGEAWAARPSAHRRAHAHRALLEQVQKHTLAPLTDLSAIR